MALVEVAATTVEGPAVGIGPVDRANGNKSHAARALGLSRNALRYRLSKIGVPDTAEDASEEITDSSKGRPEHSA